MKFESVVLNQEGQVARITRSEQESRLNTEIEASPALVRKWRQVGKVYHRFYFKFGRFWL